MVKDKKIKVYLIPGQGADYRLFSNLNLDAGFDTVYIHYSTPPKRCSLKNYAKLLSQQIDTTENFILVGVSIGGMIAVEMSELLQPLKTIIISSAKCRKELPHRYRFMRVIPLQKIVPAILYKWGAFVAQPLIEPDRKHGKPIFLDMLKDKEPRFLKRTANMIINWDRNSYSDSIFHIHGTNDHTLPLRFVQPDKTISGGSHMMVLTRADEVNQVLKEYLENVKD